MSLSWLPKDKLERNEVYQDKLLVGIFNLALLVYHINSYNSLLENLNYLEKEKYTYHSISLF